MYFHCSHMFLTSQVDDYTEVGLLDHTLVLLLAAPTQPVLSWTSSSIVLIALMSLLTQSTHLCFGLPLLLLLGDTISSICLPIYPCSRLFTWPNHLSLAFLHLSVLFSTFSLFRCCHSSHGLLVCGRMLIYTKVFFIQFLHVGDSHRHCLIPYSTSVRDHTLGHSFKNNQLYIQSYEESHSYVNVFAITSNEPMFCCSVGVVIFISLSSVITGAMYDDVSFADAIIC